VLLIEIVHFLRLKNTPRNLWDLGTKNTFTSSLLVKCKETIKILVNKVYVFYSSSPYINSLFDFKDINHRHSVYLAMK